MLSSLIVAAGGKASGRDQLVVRIASRPRLGEGLAEAWSRLGRGESPDEIEQALLTLSGEEAATRPRQSWP